MTAPTAPAGTGAELVAEERRRQVEVEGFTPEHDDRTYTTNELSRAGACYANEVFGLQFRRDDTGVPLDWPWHRSWWKPSEDPIRNLVRAGALFRAEEDRLRRQGRHAQARLVAGSAEIVEAKIDRLLADKAGGA